MTDITEIKQIPIENMPIVQKIIYFTQEQIYDPLIIKSVYKFINKFISTPQFRYKISLMNNFLKIIYKINKGDSRSHFYQWFKYINDIEIFYKLKIHAEYYCADEPTANFTFKPNVDLDFKFDKFIY